LLSELVVIVSEAPVIVSVRICVAFSAGVLESVTLKVTGVDVTAVVGIPPIAPVDGLIDSPAGKPVADQEYGVVPPVASTVAL
jgi:hypothetical protein